MNELYTNIKKAIHSAFEELLKNDGCLFKCQTEEYPENNPRKLHEVCINHKLANYLERFILQSNTNLYVDIEFNREGINKKSVEINDETKIVRPDIIVHNRESDEKKYNLLVVECKKNDATKDKIEDDKEKLKKFIEDDKFQYKYGLQVLYDKNKISGHLYYLKENVIKEEELKPVLV